MGIIMGALGGLGEGLATYSGWGIQNDLAEERDAKRAEIEAQAQQNLAAYKNKLDVQTAADDRTRIGKTFTSAREAALADAAAKGVTDPKQIDELVNRRAIQEFGAAGDMGAYKVMSDSDAKLLIAEERKRHLEEMSRASERTAAYREGSLALRAQLGATQAELNAARAEKLRQGDSDSKINEGHRKDLEALFKTPIKEAEDRAKDPLLPPEEKKKAMADLAELTTRRDVAFDLAGQYGTSIPTLNRALQGVMKGRNVAVDDDGKIYLDLGGNKAVPMPPEYMPVARAAAIKAGWLDEKGKPAGSPDRADSAGGSNDVRPKVDVAARDAAIERMNSLSGTDTSRRQGIIASRTSEAGEGFDENLRKLDSASRAERMSASEWFDDHMDVLTNAQKKLLREARSKTSM